MSTFIQLLIVGITVGLFYGLVALGFVLIYKSSQIFNFAQGEMVLVGAFLFWTFLEITGLSLLLSAISVFIIVGVFGYSLERFPFRKMIGQPILATIMATIGIAIFLHGLFTLLWGGRIGIQYPQLFPVKKIWILGIPVTNVVLGCLLIILVLVILLSLFFKYSRTGLHMRATAESHQIAQSLGVRVKRSIAISWALSAILAAFSGFVLGYYRGIDSGMHAIGFIAIAAALVGGLESFKGAVLGGVIIGVAETFTSYYVGYDLKEVVPYILMIFILLYKPYGLFGMKRIERV